jgi:ABC-type transport system substrate-binding protein
LTVTIGLSLFFLTGLADGKSILRVGMQDEPITVNPFRARDVWSSHVISPVLSSLLGYDENFQIIPMLARDWEANPTEGKVIVHLRKGVKWHDGSEFTAEDVIYTVKIIDHF